MNKYFVQIICASLALLLVSLSIPQNEWISVDQLKVQSLSTDTALCQDSADHYRVISKGNRVFVRTSPKIDFGEQELNSLPFEPVLEDRMGRYGWIFFMKVDDGYLIAQNVGEWGGCISWHSLDGKQHYGIDYTYPGGEFPIEICNPNKFIEHNGKYYVLEGVAHLGDDEGNVIELTKHNGIWSGAVISKFDSQPNDAVFDLDGNMLVLTLKGIIKIKPDGSNGYLTRKKSWPWICRSYSMATDGYFVYLGMKGGVLRCTMTEPLRISWMTK